MSSTHPRLTLAGAVAPEEGVDTEELSRAVAEAARGLRYGSVEIVVHDGRVAQIIRTDKRRMTR
jgi:hypothetical protein